MDKRWMLCIETYKLMHSIYLLLDKTRTRKLDKHD